jgi:lysyl-tRNA synthetase class I
VQDADEMQNELYESAKKVGLVNAEGKPAQEAFGAIYLAFIGKPNGPKAAWLLTSLEPPFVTSRLEEMARAA